MACVVAIVAVLMFAARASAQTPPVPPPVPAPEKPPPTVFAGVFAPLTGVTPAGTPVTRAAPDVIGRLFRKDDEKLVDLSANFRAGKIDLDDAKVLILDAPALAADEGRLAKILTDGKKLVEDFVTAGGVLVVFTGGVRGVDLGFLPGKMKAYLSGQDHDRRVAVDPEHPLLVAPQKLTPRDLGSVRGRLYPGGCYGHYEGLAPVIAYDSLGRYPIVLEGSAGKGRVLLVHLSPVEALAVGDADDRRAGECLLENILDYVRRVLAGDVPPVKPFGRTLAVTVFEDVNADGRRDADEKPVANMPIVGTFSRTDANGRVQLDLDPYTRFVQLDADLTKYRLPFWKRIPDDAKTLELGLVPRGKPFGDLTRIAFIVDTGPVSPGDDEALRFMLDEIARVEPKVDLLVVVADSAEDPRPRREALRRINPPLEVVYQPIEYLLTGRVGEGDRWEDVCGPDLSLFGFCRLYGEKLNLSWRARFISERRHHLSDEERLDVLRFRRGGLRRPPTFALVDFTPPDDEDPGSRADDEEEGLFAGSFWWFGEPEPRFHVAGLRELLAPLHPALEATVPPGDLFLSVALGDAALGHDVPLLIELAHIRPKGEQLELVELKPETQPLYRETRFTRTLPLISPEKLAPGFYALKYTAGVPGARTWRKTVSFVVPAKTPAEAALGRPWLTTGGNSFHTGAALEDLEPPLVLTRVTYVGGPVFDGSPVVTADGVSVRHAGTHDADEPGVRGVALPFCVHDSGRFSLVRVQPLFEWPRERVHVLLETLGEPPGRFTFEFGEEQPQLDATHLVVGGEFLCVVDATGHAWGFKRTLGMPVAEVEVLDPKAASAALRWSVPIAPGCRLAVATDGFLFTGNECREIANGMLHWKLEGRALADASVTLDAKHTIVTGVTTEPEPRQVVLVVRSDSGKLVWEKELARVHAGDDVTTPPAAIARDVVYVGSADGVMRAFRLEDGLLLWEFRTGRSVLPHSARADRFTPRIASQAVVSGRCVWFAAADGVLYALDRADGKPRWTRTLGLPVVASPAVSGNALLLADVDGNLYTFVSPSIRVGK